MMAKVYVVMFGSDDDFIDSIWTDLKDAKERVNNLGNELIEYYWYEYNEAPGKDYDEKWNEDKTRVAYADRNNIDDVGYEFYIKEMLLRNDYVSNYKDLPAYFTTTLVEGRNVSQDI